MSQEPPQFLPYETPTAPEKPACVPPISIVGISLGGLTILMRVFGLLGAIAMAVAFTRIPGMPNYGPGYVAFNICSSVVFAVFGVLLLAASIGCLRMKEWGRVWLIRYAVSYPFALVAEIIGSVFIVLPATNRILNSATPPGGTPPPAFMKSAVGAAMIGGQVLTMLVLMILPLFILIFLRKPGVKAAFVKQPPAA